MAVLPPADRVQNTLMLTEEALRRATQTWRLLERIDVEKVVRQVAPVAEQLRQAEDQILRTMRPTLTTISAASTALTPVVQMALTAASSIESALTNATAIAVKIRRDTESAVNQVVSVASVIGAQADSMRNAMLSADRAWREISEALVGAFVHVKRIADRRAAERLRRAGWIGIELHLDWRTLKRIVDKKGGARALNRGICAAFREKRAMRLREMVRKWSTIAYLGDRKRIVRSALKAHVDGKYELSIPALLPLADGLAAEIRAKVSSPLPTNPFNKKKRKSRTIAVPDVVVIYDSGERVPEFVNCVLDTVANRMFGDYDFASEAPPSRMNRHGILHGRIAEYSSEAHSLQAFLLIDILAEIRAKMI
jgi:hypothetical protein